MRNKFAALAVTALLSSSTFTKSDEPTFPDNREPRFSTGYTPTEAVSLDYETDNLEYYLGRSFEKQLTHRRVLKIETLEGTMRKNAGEDYGRLFENSFRDGMRDWLLTREIGHDALEVYENITEKLRFSAKMNLSFAHDQNDEIGSIKFFGGFDNVLRYPNPYANIGITLNYRPLHHSLIVEGRAYPDGVDIHLRTRNYEEGTIKIGARASYEPDGRHFLYFRYLPQTKRNPFLFLEARAGVLDRREPIGAQIVFGFYAASK